MHLTIIYMLVFILYCLLMHRLYVMTTWFLEIFLWVGQVQYMTQGSLRNSFLKATAVHKFPGDTHLLGDGGYPLKRFALTLKLSGYSSGFSLKAVHSSFYYLSRVLCSGRTVLTKLAHCPWLSWFCHRMAEGSPTLLTVYCIESKECSNTIR